LTNYKPTINIRDFTVYPTARYVTDGPKSAEEFFDTRLSSFLDEHSNDEIVIDFDGTWGYASSFKNELAVRLAKKYACITADALKERIHLVSLNEPGLTKEFWKHYEEERLKNEVEE
jgi:hypothetical protein